MLERGIDVRDVYTGKMTWRRLHVLLKQLPPDSRYKARLGGQRGGFRWSHTDFLLADLIEETQALRLTVINTRPNRRRGSRTPKFVPYPRPTDRDRLDVAEQRNSLAYTYLTQLRPNGPVAHGQPIRGPLQPVEPEREAFRLEAPTAPRALPTGMAERMPPVLTTEQRLAAMAGMTRVDRPRPKNSPGKPVSWEDIPGSIKGEG